MSVTTQKMLRRGVLQYSGTCCFAAKSRHGGHLGGTKEDVAGYHELCRIVHNEIGCKRSIVVTLAVSAAEIESHENRAALLFTTAWSRVSRGTNLAQAKTSSASISARVAGP
jgi:hypothetical protein